MVAMGWATVPGRLSLSRRWRAAEEGDLALDDHLLASDGLEGHEVVGEALGGGDRQRGEDRVVAQQPVVLLRDRGPTS
jgi:hypothetical protein